MAQTEFKEPFKIICGICHSPMGNSKIPEGELSYDGCESFQIERDYLNR